jgi:two-component system, NarL family, response regulator YdfI
VTRVALVAASPVERAGLESIVGGSDIEVVASIADVDTLVSRLDDLQPDAVLVVLDVHDDEPPPGVLAISGASGAPPVAVIASETAPGWAVDALRAGVRAVLPRDATPREITGALVAIASGLVAVHPEAIESLAVEQPASSRAAEAMHPPLTPRELDVLRMLAEGLGNKTISTRLGISEHTVKFHIASIFAKLNAGSRTEAVTQGVREGLILL